MVAESTGMGSPPRVRSRQTTDGVKLDFHGITSACAEQTLRLSMEP